MLTCRTGKDVLRLNASNVGKDLGSYTLINLQPFRMVFHSKWKSRENCFDELSIFEYSKTGFFFQSVVKTPSLQKLPVFDAVSYYSQLIYQAVHLVKRFKSL